MKTCFKCHHLKPLDQFYLDVTWLCPRCHRHHHAVRSYFGEVS